MTRIAAVLPGSRLDSSQYVGNQENAWNPMNYHLRSRLSIKRARSARSRKRRIVVVIPLPS